MGLLSRNLLFFVKTCEREISDFDSKNLTNSKFLAILLIMNEPFYTKKIYTIEELKEKLTPIFDSAPVYKAILFGSYARGEANEKSDVDIIIDSRGELLNFNFFGVMGYSEEAVEKYVDMYEISELLEGSPVLASINNNEGVVIYER